MKQKQIIVFLVFAVTLSMILTPTFAQTQSKIDTLMMLGKGLATSPDDPMDFMIVKAGIAVAKISLSDETVKRRVGIMVLDEEKYRIRNVTKDEDGSVSGSLYQNDTKEGFFSVSSVIKGKTEIWVGKLEVNDKGYHLYILEAPRKIKPVELRDKISEYCKANGNDTNCRERMAEFCENNPEDSRCKQLFRNYCRNNLDDTRCRDALKNYCENNPEMEDCRLFAVKRTAKYCEENPDAKICVKLGRELVDYCLKNPDNSRCRSFCAKNPDKCLKVVKNLADFCIDNADNEKCIIYCKEHPKACVRLARNVADLCIREPTNEKCIEYCKAHPVACKKVTASLANFCIGRDNDLKCVNYCREHPDACKRIAIELDGYCNKHPESRVCVNFCNKYPERCAVDKPIVAKAESINNTDAVSITSGIISDEINSGE